jgi:hypothetical protein
VSDEQGAARAGRNWKKIGYIGGAVFVALMLIGAIAGDPDEDKVDEISAQEQVTTSKAPTTREPRTTTTQAPTTTVAPTTTAAPTTLPPTTAPPVTAPPPPPDPFAGESVSQKNARRSASSYLDMTAFSRTGLIDQLQYEGFSEADAAYGVDSLRADWYEQAALSAANYLDMTSFSRSGLIDQLIYEGFTPVEAEHGVSTTGL